MHRLAILLLLAALAAPTLPQVAGARTEVEAVAPAGRPGPWPDAGRVASSSRPLDTAEAEAAGSVTGSPSPAPTRVRVALGGHARSRSRPELALLPVPFHLRERAAHPAHAPPSRA